ncbi:hypothetical protein ACNKHT_15360 [Shigella flexneri]
MDTSSVEVFINQAR